ncbi:hypothetical protein ACLB2K_060619 [Fragaria x ananassa]
MARRGSHPDLPTYSLLLKSCLRSRRFHLAKLVHAHLSRSHLRPDSLILNSLISVYSKSGDFETARLVQTFLIGIREVKFTPLQVRHSSTPKRPNGMSVLVTGAAGFIGSHCSLALKKRGDGVLGLDNFNSYYDPSLKRARQAMLKKHEIFIVEADLNDGPMLTKLFDVVPFTHVLHLAAQAGVRYAMQNPQSYVASNIAGFVNLLEISKAANPQPAIVWASSSSVYGLNTENPFSELHRTDQPASLYAATKKAGEEIAHTYNHIYGLSLTGLRFFTVYGPWGRPDMAYFFFTKDILQGKTIDVYKTVDDKEVARDFTYIDDIVKGCLGALDTAEKSTGSGGKKKGPAQLRIYNLGNTTRTWSGEKVIYVLNFQLT